MLMRILSALGVGLGYAAYAGGVTFLFWRLSHDYRYPGPMIPDANAWGRFFVVLMIVVGMVSGTILAVVIFVSGVDQRRGAFIGAGLGFIVFVRVLWRAAHDIPQTTSDRIDRLKILLYYFVVFPIGLMLTSLAASAMV